MRWERSELGRVDVEDFEVASIASRGGGGTHKYVQDDFDERPSAPRTITCGFQQVGTGSSDY